MKKEKLINIFVYGNATHALALGWRTYEKIGTYEELVAFLKSAVDDHRIAFRRDLDKPLLWREFEVVNRLHPFVNGLIQKGVVSESVISCETHVLNGKVHVDEIRDTERERTPPDYLVGYWSEEGFDFTQLILDDHMEAIQLLWNNKKYISCLKLVFSAIDTFGFVEHGPKVHNCFKRWLSEYCDLEYLGVTAGELWELRNSLIHMTNLDSRKVHSGETHRLLPSIFHPEHDRAAFENGMKVFHVSRLMVFVLPQGIAKWLDSYNQDRSKFAEFIERYDTIASEARMVRSALS